MRGLVPLQRFTFSLLTALLLLNLSACGVPAEPQPLAEAFITAMQSLDFGNASQMVEPTGKERIQFIQSIATSLPKDERAIITGFPEGSLQVRSVDVQENSARVVYAIGANLPETLTLVKTSMGWRVKFEARNLYP